MHQALAGGVFGKKGWRALLGGCATSRDLQSAASAARRCPQATAGRQVRPGGLHPWPSSLRAASFLLPLKSLGPSHSKPESAKPRARRTTVILGTWRRYLWKGLCSLQRRRHNGRDGGFAVRRGTRMRAVRVGAETFPTRLDGRTPRSRPPHRQLAEVRTGLRLDFSPRTFLQRVDTPLTAPGSPEAPRPSTGAPYPPSRRGELRRSSLGLRTTRLTAHFGNYDSTSAHNIKYVFISSASITSLSQLAV